MVDITAQWLFVLGSPVVPEELLLAITRHAVTHQQDDLMATVLERPTLPMSVLELYAASPNLHDPSLLRAALARPRVPASLIAAALAAPRHRFIAGGLARHPGALTGAQALTVIEQAAPGLRMGALLPLVARLGPELALTLATTTSSGAVTTALWRFDLPLPVLASALVRSCYPDEGTVATIRQWRPDVTDTQVRDLITAAVAAQPQRATDWESWEMPEPAARPLRLRQWDLATPDVTTPGPLQGDPMPQVAYDAAGTDEDTLRDTCGFLRQTLEFEDDVDWPAMAVALEALLTNPAVDEQERASVVDVLTGCTSSGSRWYTQDLDVVRWCPSKTRQWAQFQPLKTLTRHGWTPFGGQQVGPQVVAALQSAQPGAAVTVSDRIAMVCAVVDAGVDEDILAALSVPLLEHLPTTKGQQVRRTMADLLARRLTTPTAWAAYEQMLESFRGTLGELLDVCAAVGA